MAALYRIWSDSLEPI